jgi:16S rRNA (cytidine1402-2'-O)-methyltransferase
MAGILYIVATPIGNLKDITYRAIEVLSTVTIIAAEDTRTSAKLLHYYGITVPCISLHAHNENSKRLGLIEKIQGGADVALISDAGTPTIQDPGKYLVQAAQEALITIVPIPGPCAAVSALSASGLANPAWLFVGFLNSNPATRRKQILQLQSQTSLVIFYEAPHRIHALIKDLLALWQDRPAFIAREMTKVFESFHRASLGELDEALTQGRITIKGEFVLIVEGDTALPETGLDKILPLLQLLLQELPLTQAVKLVSRYFQVPKNKVYALALTLK